MALEHLVSILIPAQNHSRTFEVSVKSALAQTYKNIEIIVVSDNTDDIIQSIITPYLQKHNNIRYFKSEQQLSLTDKILKLVELAKGDYINFLMDDDILHQQKIEKMLPYFLKNSMVNLVTSQTQGIDLDLNVLPLQGITQPISKQDALFDSSTMTRLMFSNNLNLINFNFIGNLTAVLFRKEGLTEPVGSFASRNYQTDLALPTWLCLMSHGLGVYLTEIYSYFRVYDENHILPNSINRTNLLDYTFTLLVAPQYQLIHPLSREFGIAVQKCLNDITAFLNEKSLPHQHAEQTQPYLRIDELQTYASKLLEIQKTYYDINFNRISSLNNSITEPAFNIPNPIIEKMNDMEEYINNAFTETSLTRQDNHNFIPYATQGIDFRMLDIKLIAFYLPQYHPIQENDKWWGKGFTEWTNVTKAKPQFLNHEQPKLPSDLGFYDLRLINVMKEQVKMAENYGIGGFCFYYYWFNGKRLLEHPANQFIEHTEIDFPYCFCWANENWTRRWDGHESDVLMRQEYSEQDDINFITEISKSFSDPRYIKIENKPILILYRASLLPDAKSTIIRWRNYCREAGIGEVFLIAAMTDELTLLKSYGFDAVVEFPPHGLWSKFNRVNSNLKIINPDYSGNVFDYNDVVRSEAVCKTEDDLPRFRGIFPSWDNEARRPGKGHTYVNSTPALYETWLRAICQETIMKRKQEERLVFINAWNEWGEGAYLEPDRRYGYAYLQATANVLKEHRKQRLDAKEIVRSSQENFTQKSKIAVVLHLYYENLIEDVSKRLNNLSDFDLFISVRETISTDKLRSITSQFPDAKLYIFPNRGRDIFPFIQIYKELKNRGYQQICKIHTKKSTYRNDGDKLRTQLLDNLLGSPEIVRNITAKLTSNENIGMIVPKDFVLSLKNAQYKIANETNMRMLLNKLGIGNVDLNFEFVAGSMFWVNTDAISLILELDLSEEDFPLELGQNDGEIQHAIERLFMYIVQLNGLKVEMI